MTRTTTLTGVQAKAAVIKLQANPVQEGMRVCSFDHDEINEENGNFLCTCKRVKKTIKNYEYDEDAIFKLKHRGDSGLPYIPESVEGDEHLVMIIKKVMAEGKENKLLLSHVVDEVKKEVFVCNADSRLRRLFERAKKEMVETSSSDDNSNKEIRATLAELTNALKSSVVTTNENLAKTNETLAKTTTNLDTMGVHLDGTLEAVDKLAKESKRQGEQLVVHTKELGSHKKLLGKHEERISNNEFRHTATERRLDLLSRQLARSGRSCADPTRLFEGEDSPATATSLPVAYSNCITSVASVASMAAAPEMVTPATLGGSIPRPAAIASVAATAPTTQIAPPVTLGGRKPPHGASPFPRMITPTTTVSSIGGSMEPNLDVGTVKFQKISKMKQKSD